MSKTKSRIRQYISIIYYYKLIDDNPEQENPLNIEINLQFSIPLRNKCNVSSLNAKRKGFFCYLSAPSRHQAICIHLDTLLRILKFILDWKIYHIPLWV